MKMKSRCISITLLLIVFILLSSPISAITNDTIENTSNRTPVIYSSSVDQYNGFYRVIDIVTYKPSRYEDHTLAIYVGDTVMWLNDADPDEPLTIISKQGLWANRSGGSYLRWNYQTFRYTFNQSGTYDVYLREYPRLNQTIMVNKVPGIIEAISTPTVTLTANPTVRETTNATNLTIDKTLPSSKKTSFPIEAIFAIVGLIIMAIYLSRKKN